MSGVVAVATSGGRDSMALLHAAVRCAAPLGLRVVALHVHHGLQAEADAWLEGVRTVCARWAAEGLPVSFASARLGGLPARGESVERWARRERYAALTRLARQAGATLVLLAHHRRDQAETVLLQALRGGGPAGLAAMPKTVVRDGLTWARPWLDIASDDIAEYVRRHALPCVQDPSNDDPRWARSRLRSRVMPALREAFPDAERVLAASACRAHEAREVLEEVARQDLDRLGAGSGLALASWRMLSTARRRNALRAWLAGHASAGVPESLVARLERELQDDAPRRWPFDGAQVLRSWRGRLELVPVAGGANEGGGGGGSGGGGGGGGGGGDDVPRVVALRLLRCGMHDVPGWHGRLEVFAVPEGGVAPVRLATVHARARAGAEQFRRAPGASDRSLKKQFQSAGVPPEAREGPLVFDAQGRLLFVPGLGVDARAWALAGAPQWAMRWVPFARQQPSMDDARTTATEASRSSG